MAEKKYISVSNTKEMYNLGKALTNKEIFEFFPEDLEAISDDKDNNMFVQITEYDIVKNPSLIMQATKKKEIQEKVYERLSSLDQNTSDLFKILFGHYINDKSRSIPSITSEDNPSDNLSYISIDEIHFSYKGLKGKNEYSGIANSQYKNYIRSIDILANTKVKFDITKETNAVYQKIKSLKWGAIEGFLLNNIRWVENSRNNKIDGIWYDLGLIGEAFTKYIPNINEKYPRDLLRLNYKVYPTVKNIGDWLCYLHKLNDSQIPSTKIKFYDLVGETRFEIKSPGIQKYINRFLKNLDNAIKILKENKIVNGYETPEPIHTKNYKQAIIVINWIY